MDKVDQETKALTKKKGQMFVGMHHFLTLFKIFNQLPAAKKRSKNVWPFLC
jgi:hypothetical protein